MDRFRTINRDFKSPARKLRTRRFDRHHLLLTLAAVTLTLGIVIGASPHSAEATRTGPVALDAPDTAAVTQAAAARVEVPLDLPAPGGRAEDAGDATTPAVVRLDGAWHQAEVKPGDSLARIFSRHGVSARQLHEVVMLGEETRALKKLYPGDELRLQIGDGGQLHRLVYEMDEARTLNIVRTPDGFTPHVVERALEHRTAHAGAMIDDSLFLAAQRAGLSDNLTMELAAIFGWDIDFSLDIRKGDRFSVIYEEIYLNGEKVRDGDILAAEFINRGQSYRALRYTDAGGRTDFYTPGGKSVRKAFLRSPVSFTRVSSRFSLGRRHPILNTIRAHKGVDYAARRGTPVKSTGEGKIVHRGRKGGYGKTVVVQHGTRYSTLYAHLSGYARGTHPGARIRQGQIIGYVGSSGLATGPHLHYEFRVNGVHRNPLTVSLPVAEPLPGRYMDDFTEKAQPFLAQLDVIERTQELQLARNQDAPAGEPTAIAFNAQ